MSQHNEDPRKWVPEIMYEESSEGVTQSIPFVAVPTDKEMPGVLFLFASRETGETEPGPEGEELPITELDLHQYANLVYIKESLSEEAYDEVRMALGLEPLRTAAQKGKYITDSVRRKIT